MSYFKAFIKEIGPERSCCKGERSRYGMSYSLSQLTDETEI